MFNDESAPTIPKSAPSTEPTPQMDQVPVEGPPNEMPVAEPGQPEQPIEATEEKGQGQAA